LSATAIGGTSLALPARIRSSHPLDQAGIKALAVGGHISLIGSSLSRSGIMLDPMLLGGRDMTLGSISVSSRADFEAMNRAIALHRLRPVVDRVFAFDEAHEAYRYFESRAHFGESRHQPRLRLRQQRTAHLGELPGSP